jgi:hypothetical protein
MLRGRWRLAIVALVTTALGLGVASQVQAAENQTAPAFGAVDLADAVLYGVGPAAGYLAGWDRKPTEWTDAAIRTRTAVDAAIAADQRWARSFAERLQSGDAKAVNAALEDLASFTRVVADRLFGKDAIDHAVIAAGGAGNGTYMYQYDWYYQYFWVYEAFAWVMYWVFGFTADPGTNGQLDRELLVREITVNLDTRG